MNYIITDGEKYFCGWDSFGNMKFINDGNLAYRMQYPVAENTLIKINQKFTGYKILHL